jgi:hypothetical protein
MLHRIVTVSFNNSQYVSDSVAALYCSIGFAGYVSVCAAKQNPSDMKIKISYTHEDGHVDRNM